MSNLVLIVIYVIIWFIFLGASKSKFGKPFNISTVFTTIWCLFAMISSIGFYNMRKPSIFVHFLAICFVVITNITMLSFIKGNNKKKETNNDIKQPKHYGASLIQILTILLCLPLFSKAFFILISTGNLSAVRSSFYDSQYADMYFFNLIFRQAPTGMIDGLIVYYVYQSFHIRQPRYVLFAGVNATINTLFTGGRYALMTVIYAIVLVFAIEKEEVSSYAYSWIKKYKRVIRKVLFAIAGGLVIITLINRSGGLMKNIITYSAGSLSFLDLIFANPYRFGLEEHLYGYMTFGAFIEPFVLTMKFLGLSFTE